MSEIYNATFVTHIQDMSVSSAVAGGIFSRCGLDYDG